MQLRLVTAARQKLAKKKEEEEDASRRRRTPEEGGGGCRRLRAGGSNETAKDAAVVFCWHRPLGANDSWQRLTVVDTSRTASTTAATSGCWALPLRSLDQLRNEIIRQSRTATTTTTTLEVVGSALVSEGGWRDIVGVLKQQLPRLHSVRFWSDCHDRDVSVLIRSLASCLVSVHILHNNNCNATTTITDSYVHTFAALAECRYLKELKIAGSTAAAPAASTNLPFIIGNHEAELLMHTILPRLERLILEQTKFETGGSADWLSRLMETAEEHSVVAAITCDTLTDTANVDLRDYVRWNAALSTLRLVLLSRIQRTNRLVKPTQQCTDRFYPSHNDKVDIIEAAVTVLRDWYRTTQYQPPFRTTHRLPETESKSSAVARVRVEVSQQLPQQPQRSLLRSNPTHTVSSSLC